MATTINTRTTTLTTLRMECNDSIRTETVLHERGPMDRERAFLSTAHRVVLRRLPAAPQIVQEANAQRASQSGDW